MKKIMDDKAKVNSELAQQHTRLEWQTPEMVTIESDTIQTGSINVPEATNGMLAAS